MNRTETERRWKAIFHLRIADSKRNGFLHRIVTGDEKWIFYDNLKKKKYYTKFGQLLWSTSTLWPNIHDSKIMLCIWWDQKGFLVYYELLKPDDQYRLQLIRLSRALREKQLEYEQRHDKVFFFMTTLDLIKKYLEMFKWDIYCTRCIFRTLLLLITGCSEGCTGSLLSQKSKMGSKIESPPRRVIFSRWNSKIAWEMDKSSRQRWTIL